MIVIERHIVNDSEVVYNYYVEDKRDPDHSGVVMVYKESHEYKVLKHDSSGLTDCFAHVVRRLFQYLENDSYPEQGVIGIY